MSKNRAVKKERMNNGDRHAINCCPIFFLVLLISHVPSLAKAIYGVAENDMPHFNSFPVMEQWTKFFARPSRNTKRKVQYSEIVSILKEESTKVDWRPFRWVHLPDYLHRQWHMTFSNTTMNDDLF